MKKLIVLASVLALSFTACKKDAKDKIDPVTKAETAKKVIVKLEAKNGSNVTGTVRFTEEDDNQIKMVAMIDGLAPGEHAIHIHQKADCSSDDGKSAGGHWNPTNKPHGKWGDAAGYHKGDIGNMNVDDKGHVVKYFTTDEWCIGCGDDAKDILGKAIIVHEGVDDFTSQPSGAAGSRVSCGGIIE